MGHLEHKAQSPAVANCYILTISDTRTEATDTSGRAIFDLLFAGGHQVAGRKLVRDEPEQVRSAIGDQLANPQVQVIITTGGTGITSRDTTFEAIDALLEKRLDGFGELFASSASRRSGRRDAEPRLRGTRAGKGHHLAPGVGERRAAGHDRLVLPELGHLVREASR